MIGMWNGPHVQADDAEEVIRIAGEDRQAVCDSGSGNQRVESSCRRLRPDIRRPAATVPKVRAASDETALRG